MVMTAPDVEMATAPVEVQPHEDDRAVLDVIRRVSARLPLANLADIESLVRHEFRRHEADRVRLYTGVLVERAVTARLAPLI